MSSRTAIVALLVAPALAGCGGHDLSRSEYARAAARICARGTRAVGAAVAARPPSDSAVERARAAHARALADLRRLRAGSAFRRRAAALLGHLDRQQVALRRARSAAARDSQVERVDLEARLAQPVARSLGASACTRVADPVVQAVTFESYGAAVQRFFRTFDRRMERDWPLLSIHDRGVLLDETNRGSDMLFDLTDRFNALEPPRRLQARHDAFSH